MNRTLLPLLLLSAAVFAAPASANYFSNTHFGMNLNIGSAPNPTPAGLRQAEPEPIAPYVPAAAAPAPAPAPTIVSEAPPPPVQPAVRHFVVFFDFDRSNLTDEAREIVARAVRAARETGSVRVVVTGHTDTVGSFRYNQALSERRAKSVESEMTRLGLDSTEIATVGKSFSDPLVQTGPGVREPQNRRAVIDLGDVPIAQAN